MGILSVGFQGMLRVMSEASSVFGALGHVVTWLFQAGIVCSGASVVIGAHRRVATWLLVSFAVQP